MEWRLARTLAGVVVAVGLWAVPAAAVDGGSSERADTALLAGEVQEQQRAEAELTEFDQQARARSERIVALQGLYQRQLQEIERQRVLEEQRRLEDARRLEEHRRASTQATARAQAARQQSSPGGLIELTKDVALSEQARAQSARIEPVQGATARVGGQHSLATVDELRSLRAELELQREELRQLRELLTLLLTP